MNSNIHETTKREGAPMVTVVATDELRERVRAAVAATLTGNAFPYARLVVDGNGMRVTSHLGHLRYSGTVTVIARDGAEGDAAALVSGSALAEYLETVTRAGVRIAWYNDRIVLTDGDGVFSISKAAGGRESDVAVNADAVEVRGMPWDIADGLEADAVVRLSVLYGEVTVAAYDGTKYCAGRVAICGGFEDLKAYAYIKAEAAQFMAKYFDAERPQCVRVGEEYVEVTDGERTALIPNDHKDIFPIVMSVDTHLTVDHRSMIKAAQRARAAYGHVPNGRAWIRVDKSGVRVGSDWFITADHEVAVLHVGEGVGPATYTVDADTLLWALRVVDDEDGSGIGIAAKFGRLDIVGATRFAIIPETI
jgi:hypothetical protein